MAVMRPAACCYLPLKPKKKSCSVSFTAVDAYSSDASELVSVEEPPWALGAQPNMLITLCYVYMWVRFHRCYSALIRSSLSRLNSSSFSFSLCSRRATRARSGSLQLEDNVFLQRGDKAVYVSEPQVGHRTHAYVIPWRASTS